MNRLLLFLFIFIQAKTTLGDYRNDLYNAVGLNKESLCLYLSENGIETLKKEIKDIKTIIENWKDNIQKYGPLTGDDLKRYNSAKDQLNNKNQLLFPLNRDIKSEKDRQEANKRFKCK